MTLSLFPNLVIIAIYKYTEEYTMLTSIITLIIIIAILSHTMDKDNKATKSSSKPFRPAQVMGMGGYLVNVGTSSSREYAEEEEDKDPGYSTNILGTRTKDAPTLEEEMNKIFKNMNI